MKKFLFIAAALLTVVSGYAQQRDWKEKRHSFSFTVGAWPASYDLESFEGSSDYRYLGLNDLYHGSGSEYKGTMRTSGGLSLTYNYHLLKWLRWDSSVTYSGFYRKAYPVYGKGECEQNISRHYVYTMTGFSGVWLRRPLLELYSGLELGVGFISTKDQSYDLDKWFTGGQINLIGARICRSGWYGIAEIGLGMKGIFTGGLGYRF